MSLINLVASTALVPGVEGTHRRGTETKQHSTLFSQTIAWQTMARVP